MPAADLTFVGVSEDGHHLLLTDRSGAQYQVLLDTALRAAARQEHVHRPAAASPRAQMSPREVQALIRAGASADEVVELSGWTPEKIAKYEGPIVAERQFVASLATQVRLRSLTESTLLSTRVAEQLRHRGVDPDLASWDAWRAAGRPWTLQLAFPAEGRLREARWTFDLQTRAVTPQDEEARWLSDIEDHRPSPHEPARPVRPSRRDDGPLGADPYPARGVDLADLVGPGRPIGSAVVADPAGSPDAPAADPGASHDEPAPDLAPERPRTAAHRHDSEEDAELEREMRARSAAHRRRGRTMARPAPDAPSQEILPVPEVAPEPAEAPLPEPTPEPAAAPVQVSVEEPGQEPSRATTARPDATSARPDAESPDASATTQSRPEPSTQPAGQVTTVGAGVEVERAPRHDSPATPAVPEQDSPAAQPQDEPRETVVETDSEPDRDEVAPPETRAADAPAEPIAAPAAHDTARSAAAAPRTAGQRQQPKRSSAAKRKGRAGVPSWDDIMFGAKRDD